MGCWTPFRRPKDELEEIIAKKDANVECNVSQLDSHFPKDDVAAPLDEQTGLGVYAPKQKLGRVASKDDFDSDKPDV